MSDSDPNTDASTEFRRVASEQSDRTKGIPGPAVERVSGCSLRVHKKGGSVSDTLNILGPELMRCIDRASEQLEGAIRVVEEAMKLVMPADNEAKTAVLVALERSVSMTEQALDHLDVADRVAAGEAEPDEP